MLENPQLDQGPGSGVLVFGCLGPIGSVRPGPKKFRSGPLPRVVPILTPPPPVVPQSHKAVDCPSNQSGFAEKPNVDQSKPPYWWQTKPSLSSRWHVQVLMNCRGSDAIERADYG